MVPKVLLGVVFYEGVFFLPYLFRSLCEINYSNLQIIIRDQSEESDLINWLKLHTEFITQNSHISVMQGANLMHSGGHNKIIQSHDFDYYIIGSVDMIYHPDFISSGVRLLEQHKGTDFTWACFKLLRWSPKCISEDTLPLSLKSGLISHEMIQEHSSEAIIDSCGIIKTRRGNYQDFLHGKPDSMSFNKNYEVFGSSGALAMISKKAIESLPSIFKSQALFDPSLHYKNDVDLSYRLQWQGNRCLLVQSPACLHRRSWNAGDGSFKQRFLRSIEQNPKMLINSHTGWITTTVRNDPELSSLRKIPSLLLNLIIKSFFAFIRAPFLTTLSMLKILKNARTLLKQRRETIKINNKNRIITLLYQGARKIDTNRLENSRS